MNIAIVRFSYFLVFAFILLNQPLSLPKENHETQEDVQDKGKQEDEFEGKLISDIVVIRHNPNPFLSEQTIKDASPYRVGDTFTLAKTSSLINKLYQKGGPFSYFEQIFVSGQLTDAGEMVLFITTYEKPMLAELVVVGNKKVSTKDIEKGLHKDEIRAIGPDDLPSIERAIKAVCHDKDFRFPSVSAALTEVKPGKVTLTIQVNEGKRSRVKRVFFEGNKAISEKHLKRAAFTREDWILGAMNKAGSYRPENFEVDKQMIKAYYRDQGYLMAQVQEVKTHIDPTTQQVEVTFVVEEGDRYVVSEVEIEDAGGLDAAVIKEVLPLKKNEYYSDKALRDSMELLRRLWGEQGYAFVDVSPDIIPSEEDKTVSVTFHVEIGKKVRVNRINIMGNVKTRDETIRRRLVFDEGSYLTTVDLDVSKNKVKQLGFFDVREGAEWKTRRIDDEWVDVDLIVKEKKTGRVGFNLGYGGNPQLTMGGSSFSLGGGVSDSNLLGKGLNLSISTTWSKDAWTINSSITNPWLFDRPIVGSLGFHVMRTDYEKEFHAVSSFDEQRIGGFGMLGFLFRPSRYIVVQAESSLGIDSITYKKAPIVPQDGTKDKELLQRIFNEQFQKSDLLTLNTALTHDMRNSDMHPTEGYSITTRSQFGFSIDGKSNYSFGKIELDASWYTQLIDDKLVFGLHGNVGVVGGLAQDKKIPFKDLFHIGGPTTVRGFLYGQIGPTIQIGNESDRFSTIGSTKGFFVNAELIFPIARDWSMKGALFYDGGAGWGIPNLKELTQTELAVIKNQNFNFRHAIGIGFRATSPQPIKVDWGLKLDRKEHEPHMEVHFSTYREF